MTLIALQSVGTAFDTETLELHSILQDGSIDSSNATDLHDSSDEWRESLSDADRRDLLSAANPEVCVNGWGVLRLQMLRRAVLRGLGDLARRIETDPLLAPIPHTASSSVRVTLAKLDALQQTVDDITRATLPREEA